MRLEDDLTLEEFQDEEGDLTEEMIKRLAGDPSKVTDADVKDGLNAIQELLKDADEGLDPKGRKALEDFLKKNGVEASTIDEDWENDVDDYTLRLREDKRTDLARRVLPSEAFNEYGEVFAATKTEDGKSFPRGAYAYVPDPEMPSTWKLRLWVEPGGGPDSGIVGAAIAALGKGFRGQKVQIPAADLPAVKAKVRAAWKAANPDKTDDEIPPTIKG